MPADKSARKKAAVAWLSVISNTTLVAAKLVVGFLIGSVSVISEAIHSGVDLLAAIMALFAVKAAARPPDQDHPFGHGKYENVSGTLEALLIFLAAAWIIFEAVQKIRHPEALTATGWGVGVMAISAVANYLVSERLFKVGAETDSVALEADGWHLRTDVYTSGGVMVGLGAIWLGSRFWPGVNLSWLDPLAAILVALLIIKAAWELTAKSGRDLFDASLPVEEEALIRERIKNFSPDVRGFHDLKTRKAGAVRFVEVHVLVDAGMSVDESHRITETIDEAIRVILPTAEVTIHIEPCDAECRPVCVEDCLLSDAQRRDLRHGTATGSDSGPGGPPSV